MITQTMRTAAERAIGERHPYLIRFGPTLAKAAAVLIVLGGLAWGASHLAGSVHRPDRPQLSIPDVSVAAGPLVTLGLLALAGLLAWAVIAYIRSPYRVGWRLYL